MASIRHPPFERWAIVSLVVLAAVPARATTKVAFLGLHAGAGVTSASADGVGDYVQTELSALGRYEVVGLKDIDSLLGLEQKKQLLGCEDDACITELSGALGVDRAVTGSLSRVGRSLLIHLTLLDVPRAKVLARVGRRVEAPRSLDPVLDVVKSLVEELAAADDVGPSPWTVTPLVRGEVDLHGFAALASAGVVAQHGALGLSATVVGPVRGASVPVGVRLEARIQPPIELPVEPYLTAGASLFVDAPALRVSAGVEVPLSSVRLFADLAVEHVFQNEIADPVLVGVGLGRSF